MIAVRGSRSLGTGSGKGLGHELLEATRESGKRLRAGAKGRKQRHDGPETQEGIAVTDGMRRQGLCRVATWAGSGPGGVSQAYW